jgi:hypothetical protein
VEAELVEEVFLLVSLGFADVLVFAFSLVPAESEVSAF